MNTDTPRTDTCPHCGAEQKPENLQDDHWSVVREYACGTLVFSDEVLGGDVEQLGRSQCCVEREARQKLEARLASLENDNFDLANALSKAEAEVERLKVINANMRNFIAKAIHNEGFNEEQALKFIYK